MAKYQSKYTVDAWQFDGTPESLPAEHAEAVAFEPAHDGWVAQARVIMRSGVARAVAGDYIVLDPDYGFAAMEAHTFELSYEPVAEAVTVAEAPADKPAVPSFSRKKK